MPHAPGMAFNLLGGCTGKKGPKGCRGYLSLLFNNPPFLHSPDFWNSVYMHLCIFVCLHEFTDDFSSSVPVNELFFLF